MDPATRETLADLLLAWEDAYRTGHDLPATELARDRPDLAEPLARRIRVLKATFWIDAPQEYADGEPDPPPPGGRVLADRYRLDERIALGGFAEVWRAFDTELHRTVAVKIPKASRIAMKDAFMAEARRVARLRHPSITPVHDVGTDGDSCFIVSEFMDGGSLADQLTRGALEPALAIRWMTQIADALDYAHKNGVVHRDVKPANILINHHGDALLADFGIAQSATKTGEFAPSAGTLRYMAPEQQAGGSVGPPADIYSLGVVLHETLTGTTPDVSDTSVAIRPEMAANRSVKISSALPPRIAAVCRKALLHSPADRYSTAQALGAQLRHATARDARVWVGMSVAVAALIAVVPAFLGRDPSTAERSAPRVTSPHATPVVPAPVPAPPITSSPGSQSAVTIFRSTAEASPYVVACQDVATYSEWQNPPETYVGPLRNDAVCFVVYRFDFSRPVVSGSLIARTSCWDFTKRPGGQGRGAVAVDVSAHGTDWFAIRDGTVGPQWGAEWAIDESLPATVTGGTSLWVRIRLLSTECPNTTYTVAQFGRDRFDPTQRPFGIIAQLAPDE